MERQTITVDIAPGNNQIQRLKSSQGDIGRPLGVYITQNGIALDCSSYTADLYILKPDGNYFTATATVDATEHNLITWETAKQETPVAGDCAAQIRILSNGDDVGTARFVEYVEASPGFVGESSESVVESLMEYVRQAAASAETASGAASSATGSASAASGSASSAAQSASAAAGSASSAHTDAETASQAAQTAQDVADSIPEDYFTLSNDVTGLKSAIEPLATESKTIDSLQGIDVIGAVIENDATWWGVSASSDKKHVVIEVPLVSGSGVKTTLTLMAKSNYACRFAGLVSAPTEIINGGSIGTLSSVWNTPILVGSGQTFSAELPNDVKYIIINTIYNGNACLESINITSSKQGTVDVLVQDIEEEKGKTETFNSLSGFDSHGGVITSGNSWWNISDQNYRHVAIPVTGKYTVVNVSASAYGCFMACLTSYTPPTSGVAVTNFSTAFIKRIEVASGNSLSMVLPPDVKYLVVNTKYAGNNCVSAFEMTSYEYNEHIETDFKTASLHQISIAAQNVRDFSDGSGDGCPTSLVAEKLPLWKAFASDWLNQDFLCIDEWYTYFDRDMTINAYDTIFKQFFPYKYELPTTNPTQMIMSKYPCVVSNLDSFASVRYSLPMLVCNVCGKTLAVVCWLQSVADTAETRIVSYQNAITALSGYDAVILAGDFNTEQGMQELETFTDAGYTLGNGGYWGEIKTWEDVTPNDNIVTKGLVYKKFEAGETITSDHKAVRAFLCLNT